MSSSPSRAQSPRENAPKPPEHRQASAFPYCEVTMLPGQRVPPVSGFPLPGGEKSETEETSAGKTKDGEQQDSRTGARWTESDGSRVFCPVTSILAVKYAGQKKSE